MSVGPAEILIILVVALLVFGPQRLPEVARQVGSAMRELRKMQDTVRGELDMVLHPEHGTNSSPDPAVEPDDHSAIDASPGVAEPEVAEPDAGDTGDAPPAPAPGVSETGDVTSIAVEPTVNRGIDEPGFSGPSDSFI